MIGRTRPRLALAGRLARGEMMQINEQDLRCLPFLAAA
jgi:hypothetical protein